MQLRVLSETLSYIESIHFIPPLISLRTRFSAKPVPLLGRWADVIDMLYKWFVFAGRVTARPKYTLVLCLQNITPKRLCMWSVGRLENTT